MQDAGADEQPLPAAAVAALASGRLIDAIREVRAAEGLALHEAKRRVEAHVAHDPLLKIRFEQQQAQLKRRLIRWLVIIDLLLIAAAIWYFFGR